MRSVPEWIGSSDDARIPDRVRLRIWRDAEGHCQRCGHQIMPGERWDLDHCTPLHRHGEHRESNLRVVCLPCHREKTAIEIMQKAKSDRLAKRHAGIKKPRRILSWRNFRNEIVRKARER